MGDTMTTFNLQLQTSLKALQNQITSLGAKGVAGAEHAEKEIREQISAIEARGQQAKASLASARTEVAKWVDDPIAIVSGWKAQFDASRLHDRAERATRYAEAASQIAIASVEEAEELTDVSLWDDSKVALLQPGTVADRSRQGWREQRALPAACQSTCQAGARLADAVVLIAADEKGSGLGHVLPIICSSAWSLKFVRTEQDSGKSG